MKPGFQKEIVLGGNAKIDSIHVGDPTVVAVTTVSDRRFLINALSPDDPKAAPGLTRETNILVRNGEKNVIANLEVVVGHAIGEEVEIHQRLGKDGKIGVARYQCSSIKCFFVSADKEELPTQVIRREDTVNTTTRTR